MKSTPYRLLGILLLAILGIWAWRSFFPPPEVVIKTQLLKLATAASFGPKEGAFAALGSTAELASLCTPGVRVKLGGGGATRTLKGRDDVRQLAAAAHSSFTSVSVKFPDLKVHLAADKESATVDATANGWADGREIQLVELRFLMRKLDGKWLVDEAETTSTFER